MENQTNYYRFVIFGILIFIFDAVAFQGSIMPPLFGEIREEIPLSKAQIGSIMGTVLLAAPFFAPIGGAMADRIGCRFAMGVPVLLVAAGAMLRGRATSMPELMVYMAFIGAGMSVIHPVRIKVIASWFPPHELGRASGILMASTTICQAVAMGVSANVLSPGLGGWRNMFVVVGATLLLAAIPWFFLYKAGPLGAMSAGKPKTVSGNFKEVLKTRDFVLLMVFFGLIVSSIVSLTFLLPVTFQEMGIYRAGELVSLIMIGVMISAVLGGWLSDKIGKRKPFLIFPALAAAALIPCLGLFKGEVSLGVVLFLIGCAKGCAVPIAMAIPLEMKRIGPRLAGTAGAMLIMVPGLAGFASLTMFGKVMDLWGSMSAFSIMSVMSLLSIVFIIPILETGMKKAERMANQQSH